MFAKQYYMATVLCHAIQEKSHRGMKELLQMGADPNYVFEDDSSAIHVASGGDTDDRTFVALLLQQCANPNLRNAGGLTPVHAAAACGHCDILHQLLMGGGDPYQKDNNGKDAFAWAVPTARNILYMHLMEKDREKKMKMQKKRSLENKLIATISDLEKTEDKTEKESFFTTDYQKAETREQEGRSSSYTTVTQLSEFSGFNSKIIKTDVDGWSLIETHLLPSDLSSSDLFSDCSNTFDWRTVSQGSLQSSAGGCTPEPLHVPAESCTLEPAHVPADIASLTSGELRARLMEFGDSPGPIVRSTRKTHELRLVSYLQGSPSSKAGHSSSEFLSEIGQMLCGRADESMLNTLEEDMAAEFVNPLPGKNWREGTQKAYFNYLLLDPRVTQNLPVRARSMAEEDAFRVFLLSVFYIGKGRHSRPYEHFREALAFRHSMESNKNPPNSKVKQILDIWSTSRGVVSLNIFQNTIAVEAYTREACMIDAFGLDRLTNQCRGQYYGTCDSWSGKQKRQLGAWLLKRAFGILLNEGERQIRSQDV